MWKSLSINVALISLLLMGISVRGIAQEETSKPRPRIGLALSGGAALGLAHIGVLDWFERHHVPIDCIAGTSMGGLMAGGYATGMSPDLLRTTLLDIDWNDALSGEAPYRALSLRRKEDLHDLQSRLTVGLRGGIEFPSGVSPANPIDLLLSRICLPYADIPDFDALPVPFRCVAVDMHTGEPVAFKGGSLATAMRATMAIPGIFTPVARDGTLYTDGATLNNIPTEAVKAMGANIIIAVDLSASFLAEFPASTAYQENGNAILSELAASTANKKNGNGISVAPVKGGKKIGGDTGKSRVKSPSLVDIIGRTFSIATYVNERRSLKLADIVLVPDLKGLGGTDFTKVNAFAERGYQAAEARAQVLNRFALNDAEWKTYVAARNGRKRVTVPTPSFVEITGVGGKTAQSLQQELQSFVGKPLDGPGLNRLDNKLIGLTGNGLYDSFLYDTTSRRGSKIRGSDPLGLRIRATSRPYGPPILRFGVEVNGADTDNIRTNLTARLISQDIGGQGAELRTDLRVGSDRDLATEYYRPFGNGRPFFAPRIYLLDDSFGLFNGGAREATYRYRKAGVGVDLGYNTGRESQLRFGYQFEHEEASVSTGSSILPPLHGDTSALRLGWVYDGQDSPAIPTRGIRSVINYDWYFHASEAPKAFPTMSINLSAFHPVSKGDSVFGVLGGGTTFGNRVATLQQFTVGGPGSLGAYGPQEFRGNDSLFVNFGYLHRVGQLPSVLGGKVMLGGSYQAGGAFTRFGSGRYHNDLSIAFLAETLIGPVSIGYSYGEAGSNRVYFAIGGLFP